MRSGAKALRGRAPSSYKAREQTDAWGHMTNRRTIESALGHSIALEILPEADGIRISRADAHVPDVVTLEERGARILSAFLSSALVVEREGREPEEIGDVVLTMHSSPAPMVRVSQGVNVVEIHAPLWEALHCEIDLVIPRLVRRDSRRSSAA